MNTELYSRQQSLNLKLPKYVAVVGCGGTGTWVALEFAMVGVKRLALFDMDTLELSNLARLPFTEATLGRSKNGTLGNWITELRKDCQVDLYGEANEVSLDSLDDLQHLDFLVDCSDRRSTQRKLLAWTKAKGIKYARDGYNGDHITAYNTISSFTSNDTLDENGYTIIPSYAPTAILAATLLVHSICYLGRVPKLSCTASQLIEKGETI